MNTKTEALIRDVAALFVKYRASEWTPLIVELEERGGSELLTKAIEFHVDQATALQSKSRRANAKAPAKKKKTPASANSKAVVLKPAELELEPRFSGPHASTIDEFRDALVAKRSFPAMSHLKAAMTAVGIKGAGTGRRDILIAALTGYLDQLDAEKFENALHVLAREEKRNLSGASPAYDRWFDLITADRRVRR